MAKDYYSILGVPRNASLDEIKRAYRELVIKYHPDINKSKEAEEKMKEINEAYAVLSDPEKRRQYDMLGSEQFNEQYTPEDIFRGFDLGSVFKDLGIDFGDFPGFGDLFGFETEQEEEAEESERGASIELPLNLTLQEAAKGTTKQIEVKHVKKCPRCNGTGVEPGYSYVTCDMCNGTGRIVSYRSNGFFRMQTVTICPKCGGTGKIPEKKCSMCHGKGGIVGTDKISVDIPPGVREGMKLRLSKMGDYSKGGIGDLYLRIHITKDKVFQRDGDNVIVNISIPFYLAILGGKVMVPTLEGEKEIEIEPGTQPGTQIRIPGAGIKNFNSQRKGDEIININVEIPKNLSSAERKLLEDYKNLAEKKKKGFGIF